MTFLETVIHNSALHDWAFIVSMLGLALLWWWWIVWRIARFFIRLVTKTIKEAWRAPRCPHRLPCIAGLHATLCTDLDHRDGSPTREDAGRQIKVTAQGAIGDSVE
jgi:hypothetical protein